MKAIVYTRYGPPDVLQLKDIDKPFPRSNEVLITIHATSVNRTDVATIKAIPFFARIITGILRPRKTTPGTSFAGKVEAVGDKVSSLKIGDKIFGFDDGGASSHAEYTAIEEGKLVIMPENLSYAQAAACPEGVHYAYNFINKVDLKEGQSVLVNGATGAIGSAAVQLLKYYGVYVTAVCSTENIELVLSLGADKVIDYKKYDFTKDDQKYDFVFDTVGKSSFFKCMQLLNPGGVYISSDLGYMAQNIFLPLITPIIKPLMQGRKTVSPVPSNVRRSLLLVKTMIEEGKFQALIDKTYPFDDIVKAYKYVEKGHKKGNVVIIMSH